MNTIKRLLYFTTTTVIISACGNKQEAAQQESNLIEITTQQFANEAMQLGKMVNKPFENIIKCYGNIVTLPKGMAKVNAPVDGIIKNIQCFNGQSVSKNQPLIEIAGTEIIDMQKDFAEASANYKHKKNEYERIKALYNEKVTSEKDFILVETEFKTSIARYNGLKLKIEAIGFSISKVENGEFYSSYLIKSPIDGYISNLRTNIGSYIDSKTDLLEIINPDLLQVKLSVFPKDIKDMKKGNPVRYKSAGYKIVNTATISSIGVAIDNETKSIECYASITTKKLNPFLNEFVEAEVITSIYTSLALPSDAIIKDENGYFILVLDKQEADKYFFNKVEVKIGIQYDGYTEIKEPKFEGMILTQGNYYVTL